MTRMPVASPQSQKSQLRNQRLARRLCADWFAGLVPIYLAARYRPGGIYLGARCVLLVHNLAHQGAHIFYIQLLVELVQIVE